MSPPEGGTPVSLDFASAEGRFRIGLPGAPRQAEVHGKQDFLWFIINQGEFHVSYFDFDQVVDTPEISESVLNDLRDQAVSAWPDVPLEVDAPITLSGYPGRELRMKDDSGTRVDRIYLAGNRMYIVRVFISKSLDCKLGSAVKVLDTFQITK